MEKNYKKKLIYGLYLLIIIVFFAILTVFRSDKEYQGFVNNIENSTFDLRQRIISKYKSANKDLIILAIDDITYEYIMNNHGDWPITRQVWAEAINSIEKANPKYLIFDLLFLKANLKDRKSDLALINEARKNDNVYFSMSFDYYPEKVRKSAILDDKLKLKIKEGKLNSDTNYITFTNSRPVMEELSNVTKNIGVINVTRDSDSVIRNATPIFEYKENYYPNLSLRVAMDLLNKDEISIKNNSIILDEKHIIPLDKTQRAILNWYGKSNTYKHISFWEVINAQKENNINFFNENFKNKIIYIGTTAISLSDIKTVPTESNLAGVELHTTFLNNILDNNFIKKTNDKINLIISIALCLIIGYFILQITSVAKAITFFVLSLATYIISATLLMYYLNLWLPITVPCFAITVTFTLIFCIKYLLKSKDYEQTYKLAVTDGLTQLYNHRYFQEQMIINTNNFKRYGNIFSLILIDIDFFKKFNDTYGHQSGDCVLKQVANILKKNSRTSDIACRYGGEEMSIILTNTNKEEAIFTANKICLAIRNNKFTLANNEKVNVTISVGVSTIGINGEHPQELIEYADKCLYKAKENGRNQVVFEA